MKYIRLTDGTIIKGSNYGFGVGMPYKNYKVKVAGTIEELCDEWVIVDKNDNYHLVIKDKRTLCVVAKNENIYGAIWTGWGLKYVAKMNEKGELELL